MSFETVLKVFLVISGVFLFLSRISNPSVATLLSPALCFIATVKVSKGGSRRGLILLMIFPFITTIIDLCSLPNFVFEARMGIGAGIMMGVSFIMGLCYMPKVKETRSGTIKS